MKKSFWVVLLIIIVVAVYFLSSGNKTSTNDNLNGANNAPSVSPGSTVNVNILDFTFIQVVTKIKKGDTVVWTNKDTAGHTVTSDSGSELSSPLLVKGQSYSHTFNEVGTFNYHCSVHPGMKAKIIVE